MEGDLVCLIDPSPGWKSLGDPCHMNAGGSDHLSQIMGCGLTLHINPESQNHLGRTLLSNPLNQLGDSKLLGTDAIQRRELPSKRMVASTKDPSPLQRQNIGGCLDDAEFPPCTSLITAKGALICLGKESAETASFQTLTGFGNRRNQLIRLGIGRSHHPEGDPLRTSRSDPGKPPELAHQFAEGIGIIELGHKWRR